MTRGVPRLAMVLIPLCELSDVALIIFRILKSKDPLCNIGSSTSGTRIANGKIGHFPFQRKVWMVLFTLVVGSIL